MLKATYGVVRGTGGKVADKVSYFLTSKRADGTTATYTASPCYILPDTRIAFSTRPGALNEAAPSSVGPSASLNMEVDVPPASLDALRAFDDLLFASLQAATKGTDMDGITWHPTVHAARTGSAYADTMTLRVSGWNEQAERVHTRTQTMVDGRTRAMPGSVDWAPRPATQALKEKDTAFFAFSKLGANGEPAYRSKLQGTQYLVSPADFPAGTIMRLVFSVSHVLVTVRDGARHANAVYVAREVYQQPKLRKATQLMPGFVVDEEEEEAAGAGGAGAAFSATTSTEDSGMAVSPDAKRARTG